MGGMINQLIDVLNGQADRYGELLGLSREKKGVIIANDVENLQKITNLENLVVSQTHKLEKKRIQLTKDIALVLNKKESEMTLKVLTELMEGQDEQAELIEAGKRIHSTLTALSEANAQNASLIDNALDYIEYSLNILRSAYDKEPVNYATYSEELRNKKTGRGNN
ncbi:MAG: flagellar protein FlgN [Clostridiales bacterium]|jgi:flagellar biosynthesis/type III secretory pathway chaperone|nr:flagellar protein FlgN [Clostridiales bacterium]